MDTSVYGIDMLIDAIIQHEMSKNKNPFITMETIIVRLIEKILQYTRVSPSALSSIVSGTLDKAYLFSQWHDEILLAYEPTMKQLMSQDERAVVERVLSKDRPHQGELSKFASCWHKYDQATVCKWFAVDGILGNHPKMYAGEAFSTTLAKHNAAVRNLYTHYDDPATIKNVTLKALSAVNEEPLFSVSFDGEEDPNIKQCVFLYIELVGEEEMKKVISDRKSKFLRSQQQPIKRKRPKMDDDTQKDEEISKNEHKRPKMEHATVSSVEQREPIKRKRPKIDEDTQKGEEKSKNEHKRPKMEHATDPVLTVEEQREPIKRKKSKIDEEKQKDEEKSKNVHKRPKMENALTLSSIEKQPIKRKRLKTSDDKQNHQDEEKSKNVYKQPKMEHVPNFPIASSLLKEQCEPVKHKRLKTLEYDQQNEENSKNEDEPEMEQVTEYTPVSPPSSSEE